MSNQALRCRYNLYDICHYALVTGEKPGKKDCDRCLKAFRLRNGLITIIDARGIRTWITL